MLTQEIDCKHIKTRQFVGVHDCDLIEAIDEMFRDLVGIRDVRLVLGKLLEKPPEENRRKYLKTFSDV